MDSPLQTAPFFVVGSGRSGTTLLRTLLAAHSRMAVPPETHYMKWIDRFGAQTMPAPRDFDAFWAELTAWQRFRDLGLEPAVVLSCVDAAGPRDFRTIFAAMLHAYGEARGKQHIGEKTPGHSRYLTRIFEWFPDARIVVVRRDPRAVIASHMRAPWITDELRPGRRRAPFVRRLRAFHVAERARLWCETYTELLAHAETDPRMHLVTYEALVRDPEGELRPICAFLGEPFEAAMIEERANVAGAAARDAMASENWRTWAGEHEKKAAAQVSTGSLEKWREGLTAFEIGMIESICGPAMLRFGYRPDRSRPSGGTPLAAARFTLRAEAVEAGLRNRLARARHHARA